MHNGRKETTKVTCIFFYTRFVYKGFTMKLTKEVITFNWSDLDCSAQSDNELEERTEVVAAATPPVSGEDVTRLY